MENQPHTRFVLAVDPALSMGVAVGEVGSRAVAREHFPLATDEMVALVRASR